MFMNKIFWSAISECLNLAIRAVFISRESLQGNRLSLSLRNRPFPRPEGVIGLICSLLLLAIPPALAKDGVPAKCTANAEQTAASDLTVAVVNGQPIKASALDAYASTMQFPIEEALEDLIDLQLVRQAAAIKQVKAPSGPWSAEERAEVELTLARALGLDLPPDRLNLVVDHAWVKDAQDEKTRAADRALLEQLRTLVEAGSTIPEAFIQLHIDGAAWHIGDHEEYPYEVIPPEAHDLPPGSLSPIIPGDGGLHLFKIYERKEQRPPTSEIHSLLIGRLRQDATIERPETPDQ
jgi:hypothetical protein